MGVLGVSARRAQQQRQQQQQQQQQQQLKLQPAHERAPQRGGVRPRTQVLPPMVI